MELRLGYKQTEAGVIPESWEVSQVGIEFEIQLGKMLDSEKNSGVSRFYLGNRAVQWGQIDISDLSLVRLSPSDLVRFRLKKNDLLVCEGGEVGRAAIWEEPIPECYYQKALHRLRPNRGFEPLLMLYLLYYWSGQNRLSNYITQTSIAHLTREKFAIVPVPVPSSKEQRSIAAALSDTDALLSNLDHLIAKKRNIKQAVMQQLLTGKQRLPGFSEAWESQTIEQLEKSGIIKLSRGQVISKRDIESMPGSFPIYSSSVKNDGLFGRYGRFMFDEEMITWSVDGGGHFFYRGKHKFSVTNVCGFMRVDTTKLYYGFLAAQLQLLHSMLIFDYQDKAHPSVIRKAYTVLLPPLPEQAAIAKVLSEMDTEIEALTQRRDKTRAIKQGMMQELLTGRTRLA